MSPWIGISLLIVIILITLLNLYFTWWNYSNYQNDKNNISDCKNEIRKLTLLILAEEGLPSNDEPTTSEPKNKKAYKTLFDLLGSSK